MPTIVKLIDGVRDGGHVLNELVLRDFTFGDVLVMGFFDFSKLSDALKYIARLSSQSIDDLCLMTQDDVVRTLEALGEHVQAFQRKAGF